jgi:hypothetical protein
MLNYWWVLTEKGSVDKVEDLVNTFKVCIVIGIKANLAKALSISIQS